MTGVVLLEVDGPPMGRQHGVSELSEHSQDSKDKWKRRPPPRKSCGARCAQRGALNIGEAARARDGTPKALPRGHELFVGTSALGQPPPRLS